MPEPLHTLEAFAGPAAVKTAASAVYLHKRTGNAESDLPCIRAKPYLDITRATRELPRVIGSQTVALAAPLRAGLLFLWRIQAVWKFRL